MVRSHPISPSHFCWDLFGGPSAPTVWREGSEVLVEGRQVLVLSAPCFVRSQVVQTDLNDLVNLKHVTSGSAHMEANEWSDFR